MNDLRDWRDPEGEGVDRQSCRLALNHMILVPTLLGAGERMLDSVHDLRGLKPVRTVATPAATHPKFVRDHS